MKRYIVFALTVLMVLGLIGGLALAEETCERYGQGYWKQWLAENEYEDCPFGFCADELLAMLNTPARGDADQILLYQFIAASLNVNVNGCKVPLGTECEGNNVFDAYWNAGVHMSKLFEGEVSGASRQEILGWKDILEVWNDGYDPGFYLWARYDDADPYSGLCAERSYATFEDEGDGTGILTIYLFDMYGCPVIENAATGDSLPNNTFRANSDSKANDYFFYIGGAHFNEPRYPGFSSSNRVQVEPGVYELELSSVCAYNQNWEIGIGSWLQRSQVIPIDTVNIDIACPNLGVVNAENSGATWTDNEDGTAKMIVTVQDCCGNGIEGLGMDDIRIHNVTLARLHNDFACWLVDLYYDSNGVYIVEVDFLCSMPYIRDFDITVSGVIVEEALAISITNH